jgi:hypothetical protein
MASSIQAVLSVARRDPILEQSLSVQNKIARSFSMLSVLREQTIAWKSRKRMEFKERNYTRSSVSHIDHSKSFKRSTIRMLKKLKTSRNSQRPSINAWIFGKSTNKSQRNLSLRLSVTSFLE